MLKLISLNHLLHIVYNEINNAYHKKKFNEHLKENTFNTFQSKDVKCSSNNRLKIKCSCVNTNLFAHFISLKFINLVIISSILIINWLKKIQIHFNKNNDLLHWQIYHAYCNVKINVLIIRLRKTDIYLLSEEK